MNVMIIAYLFSAFACFESAITVYRLNRSAKVNRLYSILAGSFALYSIIMIQLFLSPDESAFRSWYRVIAVMACLSSVQGVCFILELTGTTTMTKNKMLYAGIYLAAAAVALPAATFAPVISGFAVMSWGRDMVMKTSGWAVCFYSYMMLNNLFCLLLCIRWRCKASAVREKKQANTLIITLSIWGLGMMHLFIPPSLPDVITHGIAHFFNVFSFTVFMAWIRYAILKYKLMTISPVNRASELFNGMNEALFVASTAGDIIFMNENAGALMGYRVNADKNQNIYTLFRSDEPLRKEIDDIIFGRQSGQSVIMAGGKKAGVFEISALGIKNEIEELIGVMIIVRQAGGTRELQEKYRLSAREMEILLLLSNGLSAHEIAQECDITLQTAKSHIHNIYQKTGLRNRVELSNLLNRHL